MAQNQQLSNFSQYVTVNTAGNTVTFNTTVGIVALSANGSVGSANQVLTSNGTAVYWANSGGGFTNGQSISVNALAITGAVTANSGTGTAGQALLSSGSGVYWGTVSGGSGTTYTSLYLQYSGNGSNTTFGVPGGYAANGIGVYLNGVLQQSGVDVDISSGTNIVFTDPPPSGALIDIVGSSTTYANGISSVVNQQFTANGTANSFTVTGGYLPNTAIVFLNGVKQLPGTDVVTTSGNTVNFAVTPANGYTVDVYAYQAAIVQSNNALTVGNSVIGLNQISIGNSTVNTVANSTAVTIGSNTLTVGTAAYVVANGNVGVSNSSPVAKLDVNGGIRLGAGSDTGTQLNLWANTNGDSYIAGYQVIINTGNNSVRSERVRIDSTGSVGIGSTPSTAKFEVNSGALDQVARFEGTGSPYAAFYRSGTREAYIQASSSSSLALWGETNKPIIFAANNVERLRISSSGIVTKPYQPVFFAYGSTTQSWSGSYNTQIIQLNTQRGLGSRTTGYNTSTYRFTAPVAGTYLFLVKITATSAASGPVAFLFVNGVSVTEVSITYGVAYHSSFGTFCEQLNAGDYVELYGGNYNNTTFSLDLSRCTLSGFLIG